MKLKTSICAPALALAGVVTSTAAQAACWSAQAVDAAYARELETMLMVSSLRCRLAGRDFISDYNSFVRKSRAALTDANDQLRDHFSAAGGLNAYDRYVTSLANRHGAGGNGSCKEMEKLIDEAKDAGGSVASLAAVAKASQVRPPLPGGQCPSSYAKR